MSTRRTALAGQPVAIEPRTPDALLADLADTFAAPSVQAVVDQLSATLDRAICVDDHRMRLVAFSIHPYGVDSVRLHSILYREASSAVLEWVNSHPIRTADPYLRLPENTDLDMRPRVCIPIRHRDVVLGYLWLIEEFRILTDDEIEIAVAAAHEAAPIMYGERTLFDRRRQRERVLLYTLLADGGSLAHDASAMALSEQVISRDALYTIVVLGSRDPATVPSPGITSRALGTLDEVRRHLAPSSCLAGILDERGILLLATHDLAGVADAVTRLDESARDDDQICTWQIAIGSPMRELAQVVNSYQTALNALRVGVHVAEADRAEPIWWSSMPAWRLVSCLADDEVTHAAMHPAIERLRADRHGDVLLKTLETYLDSGADARATADKLFMHRTSLYSRLQRIESIAAVNLRDGEDRLALHISLRVARLLDEPPSSESGS